MIFYTEAPFWWLLVFCTQEDLLRLNQEDCRFKPSPGDLVRHSLKTENRMGWDVTLSLCDGVLGFHSQCHNKQKEEKKE